MQNISTEVTLVTINALRLLFLVLLLLHILDVNLLLLVFLHNKEQCSQPKDAGPCAEYALRWYFDSERDGGRCAPFWYGGCQGNQNNYESLQECENVCVSVGRSLRLLPMCTIVCCTAIVMLKLSAACYYCFRVVE